MSDPIESKTFRKLEKERSKVGQEEENLESRDVNSSFNENSETDVLQYAY
jgi:ribosomal protein RSM22 (predicted rRNA methylase)